MPIYEYHCSQCDKDFEYLVFGNDKVICPTCKSEDVKRLLSTCGFFSKGQGGETTRASASTSACSGCTATSCSTCGL